MSHNAIAAMAVLLVSGFVGCAATAHSDEAPSSAIAAYPSWSANDPAYRFFPGDQIDVAFPSAHELDRTATVAPDGRIALPLVGEIMAANRTPAELEAAIRTAYSSQLVDPRVDVSAKTIGSRQVFVGGEVDKPGTYELQSGADALQAVLQAGGFKASAKRGDVLILRRTPDGGSAVYRANLTGGNIRNGLNQVGPLQRFDVVYVPRTAISQVGLFMQQYVRDALPVSFGLYYDLAAQKR